MCLPWETRVRRVRLWIGATQRWNKTPYIQQRCRWSLCCSTATQRLSLPSCGHDLLWVRDLKSLVGQSLLGVLHKALSTICIVYSAWSFDGDSLNEFFGKVLKFIRNAGLLLGMAGPGNLLVTPDKEQKLLRWVFVVLTHFKLVCHSQGVLFWETQGHQCRFETTASWMASHMSHRIICIMIHWFITSFWIYCNMAKIAQQSSSRLVIRFSPFE